MSKEDQILECLARFRSQEDEYMHTAVILAGDRDSQVVLSTWTTMPLERVSPKERFPDDSRLQWDWLWTTVRINWKQFSERTGMNTTRLQKVFEPLRSNRLLYPDGTIPEHAKGVLTSEVLKAMKAKTRSK